MTRRKFGISKHRGHHEMAGPHRIGPFALSRSNATGDPDISKIVVVGSMVVGKKGFLCKVAAPSIAATSIAYATTRSPDCASQRLGNQWAPYNSATIPALHVAVPAGRRCRARPLSLLDHRQKPPLRRRPPPRLWRATCWRGFGVSSHARAASPTTHAGNTS